MLKMNHTTLKNNNRGETMMQIGKDIRHFVVQNFLFGQDRDLSDEDSFFEQGIIDSTGVLELVAFVEEHFGIKVGDADLIPENLDSIQAVTAFIQRQASQNRARA